MNSVTIRVLEGMEKGRVYPRLSLPLSLGREDENDVQLNDDRVSRFHARIQEDSGRFILTDLGSTNGTKVNGHWIQQRVVQVGDVVFIGRCVLLVAERHQKGTPHDPDQTAYHPQGLPTGDDSKHMDIVEPVLTCDSVIGIGSFEEIEDEFPMGPPELPSSLTSLQRVQFSDLLSFVHDRVGRVVEGTKENNASNGGRSFQIDAEAWAKLIALQVELSDYIRRINSNEPK